MKFNTTNFSLSTASLSFPNTNELFKEKKLVLKIIKIASVIFLVKALVLDLVHNLCNLFSRKVEVVTPPSPKTPPPKPLSFKPIPQEPTVIKESKTVPKTFFQKHKNILLKVGLIAGALSLGYLTYQHFLVTEEKIDEPEAILDSNNSLLLPSMPSLASLGKMSSIVYSHFKPIAQNLANRTITAASTSYPLSTSRLLLPAPGFNNYFLEENLQQNVTGGPEQNSNSSSFLNPLSVISAIGLISASIFATRRMMHVSENEQPVEQPVAESTGLPVKQIVPNHFAAPEAPENDWDPINSQEAIGPDQIIIPTNKTHQSKGIFHRYKEIFGKFDHPSENQKNRIHLNHFKKILGQLVQRDNTPNLTIERLLQTLKAKAPQEESGNYPGFFFGKAKSENPYTYLYFALWALTDEANEYFKSAAEQSRTYINLVREAYNCFNKQGAEGINNPYYKNYLLPLCYERFAGVSLQSYIHKFVRYATEAEYIVERISRDNLPGLIFKGNERVKEASQNMKRPAIELALMKLKGEAIGDFDPNNSANLPYVRSSFTLKHGESIKEIVHLRHGTPTKEPFCWDQIKNKITKYLLGLFFSPKTDSKPKETVPESAETIPEYKGFIDYAAEQNKNIGYFNLQRNEWESGRIGRNENHRAQAILSNEQKENFFFFALPMDGSIFKGENEYKSISNDTFKDLVITSLIERKNGFHLSEKVNINRQELEELFDKVQELFYPGQDLSNTPKARQTLLLFFYAHFIEFMSIKCNLDFVVSACKDNKDRGGALTSLSEFLRILRTNNENSPKVLMDFYVNVLAPGLISKNEEIIHSRLELLTNALARINELTDEQITAIKEYKMLDHEITEFNYIPTEEQQLTPSDLSEARNVREYFEALNTLKQRNQWEWKQDPDGIDKNLPKAPNLSEEDIKEGDIGSLNIPEIYRKVKADLARHDVFINDEKINSFEKLLTTLHLPKDANKVEREHQTAVKFLAHIHQNAIVSSMERLLNANSEAHQHHLMIKQRTVKSNEHNTTIMGIFSPEDEIYQLRVKTLFELANDADADGRPLPSSSIAADALYNFATNEAWTNWSVLGLDLSND